MSERQSGSATLFDAARLARLAFLLVAAGTVCQVAFNLVMGSLGYGYPYTSPMFRPDDRWADFFKLAFTYPGGPIHAPVLDLPVRSLLDSFMAQAEQYRGTRINADHLPPFATLLALLVRRAMAFADPVLVFIACLGLGAVAFVSTVSRFARDLPDGWRWIIVGCAAYPLWFMADRGHFFSLICALTLMSGCWRMILTGRMDRWAILLLAIACNLRPNVVIMPVMLVFALQVGRFRDLVALGGAGALMLALCMGAAHALSPHYGWLSWLAGLADYQAVYVERPLSAGFVSSLPSALNLVLGYHTLIPRACFLLSAALGLIALLVARGGRLAPAQLVFVSLALMPLMTPAYSDYHLIPFLLPPMLIALRGGIKDAGDWAAFLVSIAMLIPKNYIYGNDDMFNPWSWQVMINPLILLGAALFILVRALSVRTVRTVRMGAAAVQ